MINKESKKTILNEFRRGGQPRRILEILSTRKTPIKGDVLKERAKSPQLSVVALRINAKIEKHGLHVEARYLGGHTWGWLLASKNN